MNLSQLRALSSSISPRARVLAGVALVAAAAALGFWAQPREQREPRRASPVVRPGDAPLSAVAAAALQKFGRDVVAGRSTAFGPSTPLCAALREFGKGYGSHWLCAPSTAQEAASCFYVNYGIEQDWSMDTDLSKTHSCAGVALDPTVTHPSELEPGVLFLRLAAPSLEAAPSAAWQVMSLPRLWRLFAQREVFAIKYDCEGCEYALALHNDEAQRAEMLGFFRHVYQLNIELHTIRKFLDSADKLRNLAALLAVLSDAGLHLAHVAPGGCGQQAPHDRDCPQELYDAGIPCGSTTDCSSYLFARVVQP